MPNAPQLRCTNRPRCFSSTRSQIATRSSPRTAAGLEYSAQAAIGATRHQGHVTTGSPLLDVIHNFSLDWDVKEKSRRLCRKRRRILRSLVSGWSFPAAAGICDRLVKTERLDVAA